MGVLVVFQGTNGVDITEAGKDVAMQIAAMNPVAVDKDGVDPATIEREIEIAKDGRAALDLLDLKWKEKKNFPSIIFLDIKMPRMDGWEFLNEYQQMNKIWQSKSVVIIFTIAFNPDNLAKAMSYQFVKGFKSKYLDKEGLDQILVEHFNDYL